jgi:hypothetical protein
MNKWTLLLITFPGISAADSPSNISKFIGTWCTEPCYFDSPRRPWDLPCYLTITNSTISWSQWNDDTKSFVRKYKLTKQTDSEEVFTVFGGHERSWYSHESNSDVKHDLTFKVDHGNRFAKDSIELISKNGSVFIRRSDYECP